MQVVGGITQSISTTYLLTIIMTNPDMSLFVHFRVCHYKIVNFSVPTVNQTFDTHL